MRRTSVEDLGEHRSTENRNKDRFMLHGAAPMALDDDEIDDDTAMYSAEMNANARGIFRSERNNKTSRKSDDAEISKLRRCTAWSMDSCNSERGTSSSCGSSTISRVHWDEVVCDSRELNARFKF